MTAPRYNPPWSFWPGPSWRGTVPPQDLRVSDAERSEVAEALSSHYSDGRLDQSEFNDRLEKAMSAKTHADLAGLMTDLPRLTPAQPQAPPPPARRWQHLGLLVAVALFVLIVAGSITPHVVHVPWLLIAIIAVFAFRRWSWHSHHHHQVPPPPPPAAGSPRAGSPWW
jgi:Domain of unknown function (DUF1707)